MDADNLRGVLRHFESLQDPRNPNKCDHLLSDILVLTILAVICGAEHFTEIEDYGRAKHDQLKTFLPLPQGIPSHDTLGRVFALLDPEQLEACFLSMFQSIAEHSGGRIIAIDGKALRQSFDRFSRKAAIHMVSAWCEHNHLVLGQWACEEKSNEITAIPKLLELLNLKGAVVTIDAMGCQRDIAPKIIDGGGDYILAVKDNQPTLHEDLKLLFEEAIPARFEGMGYDQSEQVEKGHGRLETRRVWVTREVDWLRERGQWADLRGAVCVESVREVLDPAGGPSKISTQRRYYITSLDHRQRGKGAAFFAGTIRGHWGVENKLHWSLDVSFAEDACRVRQGHAAENLSRIRRLALNLLRQEKSLKLGIKSKRKRCGWDQAYLLKVLAQVS